MDAWCVCHHSVEASCGIRLSETVAARDGGAKPTGAPLGSPLLGETYSRRVSERRMPQLAVRGKTQKEKIESRSEAAPTISAGSLQASRFPALRHAGSATPSAA